MPIIETDLKDVLAKIDARLERMEEKLDCLDSRVKGLEDSQNKQTWALAMIKARLEKAGGT